MCVLYFTFRISKLGSGSDFEAYFSDLGLLSGRVRYTKNKVSNFLWDFPGNNSGGHAISSPVHESGRK